MTAESTSWHLIRDAASGDTEARSVFGALYLPVVRTYLKARWEKSPLLAELEDAVQDFFIECFRENGVLTRASGARDNDGSRDGDRREGIRSFRAFLYGVVRNIAARIEKRDAVRHRREGQESLHPSRIQSNDDPFTIVFDRAWAKTIMRQAADLMRAKAKTLGPEAVRRVELLQLRFYEGKPIRDIASDGNEDATRLYREFDRAGREFRASLREVVGLHDQCAPEHLDARCDQLLDLLSPQDP